MRVVVVDGDVSYPPTSGKRLRTLHLMLRLARRHRITYLARATQSDDDLQAARGYLDDHDIELLAVHDPLPRKTGPGFYARLAANVASPLPYSVASHQSPAMRTAVNELSRSESIDLWQCEWTGYLMALQDQPREKRLLIAHNVDSLIWQRYYETERRGVRRWFVREQWRKFQRFERTAFKQAARVVAVSHADAELMGQQFGVDETQIVENGIDAGWFADANGLRDPHQYLFLGSLDWRPNQDGVRRLLDDIVPRIRLQDPQARLVIVGRKAPVWLRERVKAMDDVELCADVPDVRPFLAQSSVMIVPLRIGGGSRLKILEALATGLPVVSTTIGAEGLRLTAGQHFVEANTNDELAAATVRCLREPDWARAMAAAGRAVAVSEYDWQALADQLHEVWMSFSPTVLQCR